jgi:hypothetical protein
MVGKFIVRFSAHAVIRSLEHTVIFCAGARLATGTKLCAVLESEHTSFSFSLLL